MIEADDTSRAARERAAWIEAGRAIARREHDLSRRQDSLAWEVGDWINAIALPHGQIRTIASELGLDEGTLRNRKSVAARVPSSRRRETLSWSHHQAVVSLDEGEADRLLHAAELYTWPVTRMREEAQAVNMAATLIALKAENAALRAAQDSPEGTAAQAVIARTERRLKAAAGQLKAIYTEIADILADPELAAASDTLHGNARRSLSPRFEKIINGQAARCAPQMARIEAALAIFEGMDKCHDAGIFEAPDPGADPPASVASGGGGG